VQSVWFAGICAAGVIYAFVLAPFQGNDEFPHYVRSWSVALGQMRCNEAPAGAVTLMQRLQVDPRNPDPGMVAYQAVRERFIEMPAKEMIKIRGYNMGACVYPPLAYLLPALMVRSAAIGPDGKLVRGGMIRALYRARLADWAAMCLAILLLLFALPWARHLVLAFFSIPEVVQQSIVINNDLFLFVLAFVVLVAMLRRPSWGGVAAIAVAVTLMTVTKPVYAFTGMVALPALVELAHQGPRRRVAWQLALAFAALFVAPILLRKAWTHWVHYEDWLFLPQWEVYPGRQIGFLSRHPWMVFPLFWNQLLDTFSHDLVRGSWRSIFGALGSSAIELSPAGYAFILVAVAAAACADFLDGRRPPPIAAVTVNTRARRWAWAGALFGILSIFPAIVLAMYVMYTSWASWRVLGVQGRYYLIPLLWLAVLGLRAAKLRWPRDGELASRLAGCLAAAGAFYAVGDAIRLVALRYWSV
jgi:uncharacterized membrane protein